MQTVKFEFEKAKKLFEDGPVFKVGKRDVKNVSQECKDYLSSYFFQSKSDNYCFWDVECKQLVINTKDQIKNVYLGKLSDEVCF